jgi:hypothetical protein
LEQTEQLTLELGQIGTNMQIDKEAKEYLVESKIKSLNGKIELIGTEEDFGETLEDLQAKIQALTNLG